MLIDIIPRVPPGNFMVSLELQANDGTTVFHSSRPTILRPSTPSVRFLSQMASHMSSRGGSLPLPLPFTSPSLELMTVTLFDRLVIHPSPSRIPFSNPPGSPLSTGNRRVTRAVVRVGREDAEKYWLHGGGHGVGGVVTAPASGDSASTPSMLLATSPHTGAFRSRGELQTVSVGLRFDARLQGLRWFLYAHPILSFLLFTSLFLAFELLSALTLWTIAAVYTSSLPGFDVDLSSDERNARRAYGGDDDGDDGGDDGDDGGYTARGLRRRTGAGVQRQRRSPSAATTTAATGGTGTESSLISEDGDGDGAYDDEDFRLTDDGYGDDGEDEETITDGDGDEQPRRTTTQQQRGQSQARSQSQPQPQPQSQSTPASTTTSSSTPPALLTPSYRRVLGRLDEETEEETDDVGSVAGSDVATLGGGSEIASAGLGGGSEGVGARLGGGGGGIRGGGDRGGRSASESDGDEVEDARRQGVGGTSATIPAMPSITARQAAPGSITGSSTTDSSTLGSRRLGSTSAATPMTATTGATSPTPTASTVGEKESTAGGAGGGEGGSSGSE